MHGTGYIMAKSRANNTKGHTSDLERGVISYNFLVT